MTRAPGTNNNNRQPHSLEDSHVTTSSKRTQLVFKDPLTKPQPKRRQVSKACDWCRKLRIKCDSRYPCNNCQIKGRTCNARGASARSAQNLTLSDAIKRVDTLQDRLKDLERGVEATTSKAQSDHSNAAIKAEQLCDHPQLNSALQHQDHAGGSNKKNLECIHIGAPHSQQRHCYGRSSSIYFIGRLSAHLGIPAQQLTPSGLIKLDNDGPSASISNQPDGKSLDIDSPEVLITETYLTRAQEEYFLNLFWPSYNVYYPIVDYADFKDHYQSLWTSNTTRKPSALVDILLAICMHYADALMPRGYPAFRTSVEEVLNINAVVAGRKFYKRCQLLLTDELESPSITTVQCHFFSVIYLSNACLHNAAYSHLAVAIRSGMIMGLHWEPSAATLPAQQVEFRKRLWWTVYALEIKVAMELDRPLLVDTSQVTCLPPERHQEDPQTYQGTNRFTANKHLIQLMLLGRSVYNQFQQKCSEVLDHNNSSNYGINGHTNNLCTNPAALELVAEAVASTAAQSLQTWPRSIPKPLMTKRRNSGEPLSTDRSALNLKENVLLGVSRQRLFLEIQYHNLAMNLHRPFICFSHQQQNHHNHYHRHHQFSRKDTVPIPPPLPARTFTDLNAECSVNHAITITNIIHQVLKETNFLAGFHEAFQWQWNATITLIGFIAARRAVSTTAITPFTGSSENSLTASARNSLLKAIGVFDVIGKYLGIACSAAKVARDLSARVDQDQTQLAGFTDVKYGSDVYAMSGSGCLVDTSENTAAPDVGTNAASSLLAPDGIGTVQAGFSGVYMTDCATSTWDLEEQAVFASSWATYPFEDGGGAGAEYAFGIDPM